MIRLKTTAAALVALMVTLGGCGETGPAGTSGTSPTPENQCLLDGAAPFSPSSAHGGIQFFDGDDGLPNLVGGDPTGDWAVNSFTLYLPDSASALVSTEESSLHGTAWVSMTEDGLFSLAFDMHITISLGEGDHLLDGPVLAGGIGSYTMGSNAVQIDEDCFFSEGLDTTGSDSSADDSLNRNVRFEQNGDNGQFLVMLRSSYGEVGLLVDVSRN